MKELRGVNWNAVEFINGVATSREKKTKQNKPVGHEARPVEDRWSERQERIRLPAGRTSEKWLDQF